LQETETAANVLDFAYNAAKLRWEHVHAPNEQPETGTFFNDRNLTAICKGQGGMMTKAQTLGKFSIVFKKIL
jgi:hypothetical protein